MNYELSRKNQKLRRDRFKLAIKKGTHSKHEWEDMVDYFEYICVRCKGKDVDIVKDHIIPIYQGGSNSLNNIQPLCRKCNASKGPEDLDWRPSAAYYLKKFPKYTQQGGEHA